MTDPLDLEALKELERWPAKAEYEDGFEEWYGLGRRLREGLDRAIEIAEQARATNTRLNYRVTAAEGQVRTTVEDCRRQGVSLGRGLANAACHLLEEERDQARQDVLRLRDALDEWSESLFYMPRLASEAFDATAHYEQHRQTQEGEA